MTRYIDGISFHAQDRLAERYGITSEEDLEALAELVLRGQKGQHWFPADVGPQDQRLANPRTGRMVKFKGQDIVFIVAAGDTTQRPIIVTVFDDRFMRPEEGTTASPRELEAQVKALTAANGTLHTENEVIKGKLPLLERALEDRNDEIARLKGVIEDAEKQHLAEVERFTAEIEKFDALKLALKVVGPYL